MQYEFVKISLKSDIKCLKSLKSKQSLFQAQSTWFLVANLRKGPQKKRYVEKWCVRRFLPSTHGLASLFFTRGSRASFSGARTVSFCGSRGLPDVPGLCVDSPACFPAARRSAGLCVEISLSQQALRRFLLGSRAALSLRGRASKFRSSRRRRVDQRQCAAFFLPRNKLCVENFAARSVQVKKRSLFGPETSGNRRQALSKPLESTFTTRQEFSKAAGQQQGSSPL
ncbi:hypothetical protein NDU88_000499 [Pleurodeles waltl]|uniref:Uncharacterized protein n=1 Tax=Pleurodeles waltl TaxID=8319 RepID=A0AAV7THE2_PLEWA|nr:hypothetical protein NDU88_000499 [Pleurodeles waltl]